MNSKFRLFPGVLILISSIVGELSHVAFAFDDNPGAGGNSLTSISSGAELFAERCAHCHGSGIIAPDIAGIGKLPADEIYHALSNGIMREAADGLDDAERRAIANYVSTINPQKPSRESKGFCGSNNNAPPIDGNDKWPGWSHTNGNTRYLETDTFSIDQLQRIRMKWAFVFPDTGSLINAGNQPTISNGRLYIGNRNKAVYSLNALTGCVYWEFEADASVRSAVVIDGELAVFGDYETNVYALDAMTGELKWRARADEQPSARISGNLIVQDDAVYVPVSSNQEFVNAIDPKIPCCSFRGSIVAFETQSGKQTWKTYMIEEPLRRLGNNEIGVARYGPSGGAVWSVPTVDARRGLLYVGVSNQYTEPAVMESDAVIALDLATGEKKWLKGFGPELADGKDIWNGSCVDVFPGAGKECPSSEPEGSDRDLASPVVLHTRKDGSEILLVGSKDGMFYALDPDDRGKVLWKTRVGKLMSVKGPSFGGIEHGFSVDRENAYLPIADIDVLEDFADGVIVAVDLMTGKTVWKKPSNRDVCNNKPAGCINAYTAPTTVINDVVFSGSNDGYIRAHKARDGQIIWEYDTAIPVDGVNGLQGTGGSISRSGIAYANRMLYQSSGYGFSGMVMPGNVLFAFEIPVQR